MPNMRELTRHLSSVNTVGQIAGAMRTVATAKYQKLKGLYDAQLEFEKALDKVSSLAFDVEDEYVKPFNENAPACYILVASGKGFCGSYNSELFAFFDTLVEKSALKGFELAAVNKEAAAHIEKHGKKPDAEFFYCDEPTDELCKQLSEYAKMKMYKGEASSVSLVKQHFVNALTQIPECKQLLPFKFEGKRSGENKDEAGEHADSQILIMPDPDTIAKELEELELSDHVRTELLDAALAREAATMVAMRGAYDNAQEVSQNLDREISRKRQTIVTSGVIETASAMNAETAESEEK